MAETNFKASFNEPTGISAKLNGGSTLMAEFGSEVHAGLLDPYDELPEMDGLASPGVSDKFSRGDHVHPSDNGKVDVTEYATNMEIQNIINTIFAM